MTVTHTCVGDLSNLFRLEDVPFSTSSHLSEGDNGHGIDEVDECVADVAVVGKVDSKVHEVVLTTRGLVEVVFQACLIDTVGNVSQHESGSNILTRSDLVEIDDVVWASSWRSWVVGSHECFKTTVVSDSILLRVLEGSDNGSILNIWSERHHSQAVSLCQGQQSEKR